MTANLKVPLYPEHPSAKAENAPEPLYKTKKEFLSARQSLLGKLERHYPDHFGQQGKPWAIGLREELLEATKDWGYPAALICHTLHYFSRSVRYLTNCVLSGYGAPRVQLDGRPEGVVQRRELVFALTQLSGMVRRNDAEQSKRYREWALREMALGLLHGDLTPEALAMAKVRKGVIKKALGISLNREEQDRLQLRNRRTGEVHPSIYAMPYLPPALQRAFEKRHPDHVTARKSRSKSAKPQRARAGNGARAQGPHKTKSSWREPSTPNYPKPARTKPFRVYEDRRTCSELLASAPKAPQVIIKRRRVFERPEGIA